MKQRTSLSDLARKLSISKTTISLIVNGKHEAHRISPDTVKRVQEAVAAAGFTPNAYARGFRLQTTRTIGLVVGDLSNHFFSQLEQSIEAVARQNGYGLLIAGSNDDSGQQAEIVESLIGRSVDGLIVVSASGKSLKKKTAGNELPIVYLDRKVDQEESVHVLSNNGEAVEELIGSWLDAGLRQIAFIGGAPSFSTQSERLEGFLKAHRSRGLRPVTRLHHSGHFASSFGYGAMEKLLRSDIPFDGVFTASFTLLEGVVQYLRQSHKVWPEDIRLGTFDDHPLLDFLKWPVDAIAQQSGEMGRVAFDALIKLIEGKKVDSEIRLPCRVITRNLPRRTDG